MASINGRVLVKQPHDDHSMNFSLKIFVTLTIALHLKSVGLMTIQMLKCLTIAIISSRLQEAFNLFHKPSLVKHLDLKPNHMMNFNSESKRQCTLINKPSVRSYDSFSKNVFGETVLFYTVTVTVVTILLLISTMRKSIRVEI